MRNLILVLGDQLDRNSAAFDEFDPDQDAVWMAEVHHEAAHVWCHKLRLVAFFSAMRHFRDELREREIVVHYHALTADPAEDEGASFGEVLGRSVAKLQPERLIVLWPGDARVKSELEASAEELHVPLDVRADRHYYCSLEEFDAWAADRKLMRLEDFYRKMRKQHQLLLQGDGTPEGDAWNFDADNRETFSKSGPPRSQKDPRSFQLDEVTEEVMRMVEQRFADHPGTLEYFDLPVTRKQALALLRDFIEHRLELFGKYEDAMWTDEPFLYHSRLSFALNMHLLNPHECVAKAIEAYEAGRAPINSVEGFVRQLVGWREFIRGIYWREMPRYIERNALQCDDIDVPSFFWDGETDMRCIQQSMQHVLRHGYAHHIHRLMVLGLFAQLLGVHPRKFHDWHMAMYADAVDWVSLPNTLGMSQFGDGGIVGTKPYCASGNYIQRMGNFCGDCRYNPKQASGDKACPFTTLYWDFLQRHQQRFRGNNRMLMQLKNLDRKKPDELREILDQAEQLKANLQVTGQ